MLKIDNYDEFKSALKSERAIFFVGFSWSGQSKLSRSLVKEWYRTWNIHNPKVTVSIYEVDGDLLPEIKDWLLSINESGGYGSLNWFEHGELKNRVSYVCSAGIASIAGITNDLWQT